MRFLMYIIIYIVISLLCWGLYAREVVKNGGRINKILPVKVFIPLSQMVLLFGSLSLFYIRKTDKENREETMRLAKEYTQKFRNRKNEEHGA